jgi:diguanylate cyclase (GGDEF)-like protein/PAS domain S-box-containing protein
MSIDKLRSSDLVSLLGNLWDGIYIVDAGRRITYWSKAAEDITGYTAEEAVNLTCGKHMLAHHTDSDFLCEVSCPLSATLFDGTQREARVFLRHKNGLSVPVFVRIFPLVGDEGKVDGVIQVFRKVEGSAESAGLLAELEKHAHIDALTGAARRDFGEKVLEGALKNMETRGTSFGILLLDLDRFKTINDTYGHSAGDTVLREVAHNVKASLRNSDLLIRWGGDEFLVLAPRLDMNGLYSLGEKLRRLISDGQYRHNDIDLFVGASVGAIIPNLGESLSSLLERVDTCLYTAKRQGKNRVVAG